MGEWAEIRDNYYMLNKTSGELYEITPCYDQPPVFTYINCRMSYGYDIQNWLYVMMYYGDLETILLPECP